MEMKDESLEPRHRKKKLINEVKTILEFYFSPANISKDLFMQKNLDKDSYINLKVFFKFNKIKRLTNEKKILQKAVKKSHILQLSEDGNSVKRSSPLEFKTDEMECTIYVENIPPNSTLEWLQKVFSLYGTIDYISLPKFQQTGRPKGFAFVEFSSPQEAQKALEAFGGLASLDGTLNPSDLLSIRSYYQTEEENENERASSASLNSDINLDSHKRSATEAFTSENAESEVPAKKCKLDAKDNEKNVKKKKKRKRSKKEKEYELDSVYLRVMSKKDWKTLRNKYLNMQKENMKQLKLSMFHSNDPVNVPQKFQFKDTAGGNGNSKIPKFQPDVIVKIALNEPPQEPTELRNGLSGKDIAYVDVSSENKEIFIRFKSSDAAKQFVKESPWENPQLLKEEEEKEYWEKILNSWMKKRPANKQSAKYQASPMSRGREKIIHKALKQKDGGSLASHIIFKD